MFSSSLSRVSSGLNIYIFLPVGVIELPKPSFLKMSKSLEILHVLISYDFPRLLLNTEEVKDALEDPLGSRHSHLKLNFLLGLITYN